MAKRSDKGKKFRAERAKEMSNGGQIWGETCNLCMSVPERSRSCISRFHVLFSTSLLLQCTCNSIYYNFCIVFSILWPLVLVFSAMNMSFCSLNPMMQDLLIWSAMPMMRKEVMALITGTKNFDKTKIICQVGPLHQKWHQEWSSNDESYWVPYNLFIYFIRYLCCHFCIIQLGPWPRSARGQTQQQLLSEHPPPH